MIIDFILILFFTAMAVLLGWLVMHERYSLKTISIAIIMAGLATATY